MAKPEIISRLGLPCETLNFEAEDREETVKLYAYLNAKTGSNLTVEAFPPRPAMTFFNYNRKGLSIGLVDARVFQIHAYTGVLSGYIKESRSCLPTNAMLRDAALINTLDEVQSQLGKPDQKHSNEFAPVPEVTLSYNGIAFHGREDDGRLATLTVTKRKW
jgi:hypothetical protein